MQKPLCFPSLPLIVTLMSKFDGIWIDFAESFYRIVGFNELHLRM